MFDVIAFDADDTLWHNERLYINAQARLVQLLAQYHSPEWISGRLYHTEMRNLQHFGYGVKAFALSMIETAIELTEGRISGRDIQTLITTAKEMLSADVELLDHVAETIPQLAARYPLMLITKGDLVDQERKIARSGLGPYFRHVKVVSDKTRLGYERLLREHSIVPERLIMVGNSLRSDILPILELGGIAVYVPYVTTWAHEVAKPPAAGQPGYFLIEHLGMLPALLEQLEHAGKAREHGVTGRSAGPK
ncbi:MAG: HAD family hydrolase [Chloroflexi bacterium]|nr:HAD family hydrolase [Chloroflexota bacterium]